jgi:protein-tyrosine phosphatase
MPRSGDRPVTGRRHVEIVCTGNICRSPVAEVVLRHKLAQAGVDDVVVTSSGTEGWNNGEPLDRRAAAALRRRGYDVGTHRAQAFRSAWFAERHLVLAMDSGHLAVLRRRGGDGLDVPVELFGDLDVPDPYYGEDAGFDDVLTQIELAADRWVERLRDPATGSSAGRSRPAAR